MDNLPPGYRPLLTCLTRFCLPPLDSIPSLLVLLRLARQADFEETIKEFSAKLSLVPLPPPGQLHVVRKHPSSSLSAFCWDTSHTLSLTWFVFVSPCDQFQLCFWVLVLQPPSHQRGPSIKERPGQPHYRHRPASSFPLFHAHNTTAGNTAYWDINVCMFIYFIYI